MDTMHREAPKRPKGLGRKGWGRGEGGDPASLVCGKNTQEVGTPQDIKREPVQGRKRREKLITFADACSTCDSITSHSGVFFFFFFFLFVKYQSMFISLSFPYLFFLVLLSLFFFFFFFFFFLFFSFWVGGGENFY
eukprot:TRINITY_DN6796_c0_g1_i6.p1 TRINITY_DN6796_c0_g1~~TRINITY_DN6796_c0_g1_i6.p1  ORF type:complete len:136 (-),score=14.01 TRINITY_DN6796_c0_g1_i6:1-408(-)